MLDLETRMEILGITVYQDSDRPTQFYYLPQEPQISVEGGVPVFDLFTYRKAGEDGATLAGGFLNMAVDVGIGALKSRIHDRLREQFGDEVTLSSVPMVDGSARLIGLGEDSGAFLDDGSAGADGGTLVTPGPRFIEEILGAAKTSLDEENRAIFSLSLNEDGAAFFLGVLQGASDARPLGVVYDLDYIGLLPAYDLEIEIDFESSYDFLRSRFTLGTLFFKADVDNIVEELKQQQSIRIKDTARTLELSDPEAIAKRQERIDTLVKDLATGALFRPSLTPGQPKVSSDTITAADPTGTVGTSTGGDTGSDSSRSQAAAAIVHGPSAGVVGGMSDAFGPAARPSAGAGGADGGGAAEDGGAAGDTGGAGSGGANDGATQPDAGTDDGSTVGDGDGDATAAEMWNRLGRPQAAYALKTISQEEERVVRYNLTQTTAQKHTVSPQNFIRFLAGPGQMADRIHEIDLNHQFFSRLDINVNAAEVDFPARGVTQMTVQLRYGTREDGTVKDTGEVILRSAADAADFTFFVDDDGSREYEYKLIVDYRSDFGIGVRDTRVEGPWTRTEARSLSVNPLWLGLTLPVTVQLAPNVPEDITEIHARVTYRRPDRGIEDTHLAVLTRAAASATVPIRMIEPGDPFEVARTVFYADGTSEDLPLLRLPDPESGEADEVVVVSVPRADRLEGDVIMVDALGELSTVIVDTQVFQRDELIDSRSIELSTPGSRQAWSVRLAERDQPATLRCRQRRIYADGGVETGEWHEPPSTNIVAGIPAEGVLGVTVRYIGPAPSGLGISALVLDLEYADDDPEFAQQKAIFIDDDPSSHVQDWRVRKADRRAAAYRWQLQLFHADGTESVTDPTTDDRELLTLRVPQL